MTSSALPNPFMDLAATAEPTTTSKARKPSKGRKVAK